MKSNQLFPSLHNVVVGKKEEITRPNLSCAAIYGGRIWATNAHIAVSIPVEYFVEDEAQRANLNYKMLHRSVMEELTKTNNRSITFGEAKIAVEKKDGSIIYLNYSAIGVNSKGDNYKKMMDGEGVILMKPDEAVEGFTRHFAQLDGEGNVLLSDTGVPSLWIFPSVESVIPEFDYGYRESHSYSTIGINPRMLLNLNEAFVNPNEGLKMFMPQVRSTKNYPTGAIVVTPVCNEEYPNELGIIMPVTVNDWN